MRLIRDDGAVVFLNGTEVWRDNISAGAALSYNTFANALVNGAEENSWIEKQLINNLVVGNNTIAVSVHQRDHTSSDISFNCQFIVDTNKQDKIIRGPYLQNATSNSMTVRWRTFAHSSSSIRYGTDINNLNLSFTRSNKNYNHELILNNLQPATRYYYAVYNEDHALAEADSNQYFQTNPLLGQAVPTTVWVLGDCGTKNANQRAVRDAYYNYIGENHTDALLFLGDNAYDDGTDNEYQRAIFENMYEAILRKTNAWSCIGNHDVHSANATNQSGPYFDIFNLPKQGEAGGVPSGTEAYYSFDYGNIHFVVLNSNNLTGLIVGSPMYNWCRSDLQNTNADWIISLWHHPPYTKGSHNSDIEQNLVQMRQNFLPLLEANGVDLVLCGHSHSYERSYFLNGHTGFSFTFDSAQHVVGATGYGNGRENGDGAYEKVSSGSNGGRGAVYITAGSSGKISGGALNHPAMYSSLNLLGSCVLEINGQQLNCKFIRDNGQVADYFTILKTALTTIDQTPDPNRATLDIFPNPAQNYVRLQTTAQLQGVQIFDQKGVEVKSVEGHPSILELETLPAGWYMVVATTQDGQHLFQQLVINQ